MRNTVSMNGKIKRLLYFIGIFFLIFPPHIIIHGFTVKTVLLFIFIPGIIGGLKFITIKKGHILEKQTLLFMFVALIYFSFLSLSVLFKDISLISQILTGVIILFACYYYVNSYYRIYGERYIIMLFKHLNIACIINSLFVIATFVSPHFKTFLYSFIGITELSRRYLFGDVAVVRYQGIVPSGFSFLSTTHALLLIAGVWGFFMDKRKYFLKDIIFFSFGQIIIFLAILLIGRTGLIVISLFIFALIFYRLSDNLQNYRASKKSIKFIGIMIVIVIIAISTMNFSKYRKNLDFAFELVISLTQKGSLDRSSKEVVTHQLFIPHDIKGLLIGNGNFGRSHSLPYVDSDAGLILFINGAGLIGLLIGFSFLLPGFYYSYRYRKKNSYLSWFIAVYLIVFIILNLKDYYFISQVGYSQVYFIAICILSIEIDRTNNKSSELLLHDS